MKDLFTTSKSQKWQSPRAMIDDLKTVFPFDLDPAASSNNVCDRYFTEQDEGLSCPWDCEMFWLNPPYNATGEWVKRAWEESQGELFPCFNKKQGVCLVKSATDTRWYHEMIPKASFIVNIKGRLTFGDDLHWVEYHIGRLFDGKIKFGDFKKSIDWGLVNEEQERKIKDLCLQSFVGKEGFEELKHSRKVKKTPAGFPSMFLCFGQLNDQQKSKLASYGIAIKHDDYYG